VQIEPGIGAVPVDGSVQIFPPETTTYTITATGTGGSTSQIVLVTVLQPPAVTFTTEPDTVMLGEAATLTWSSANADTCVIEPDVGAVDFSGSVTVSPTETTTYTLAATGAGVTVTQAVTVTVIYQPAVQIIATPETIDLGNSAVLTWSATHADTCVIEPGIGSVDVSGSVSVSPFATTAYDITATGDGGVATASVTLTVIDPNAPPTVTITASPGTISQGGSTMLTWTSTNAESAHIDQGVGVVPADGSSVVAPENTTTYTITVTGATGTASETVTVMVAGAPESQPEGSFGDQYDDLVPPDATVDSYDPKRFSLITGIVEDLSDDPVADDSTRYGRGLNRRIEIELSANH
jgi:hypothetical protein